MRRKTKQVEYKKTGAGRSVLFTTVFALVDFAMIFPFIQTIHNEFWLASIATSLVAAISLDASPAIIGHLFAQTVIPKKARFRRRIALLALTFAFLLSYCAILYYASLASNSNGTDLLQDGSVPRLMFPLVTSIINFFLTFSIDPLKNELARVESMISETKAELDRTEVEIQRYKGALMRFDPDFMDRALLQASLSKLKLSGLEASQRVRIQMANQLGNTEANHNILELTGERGQRFQEVEEALQSLTEKASIGSEIEPDWKVLSPVEIKSFTS